MLCFLAGPSLSPTREEKVTIISDRILVGKVREQTPTKQLGGHVVELTDLQSPNLYVKPLFFLQAYVCRVIMVPEPY